MQIAREAGRKLFLSFSPSEKRFAFLRRPQITLEAFSMMGEAITMRNISHGKNRSRKNYSQNLGQYDLFARLGSSGNSRESFAKKPGVISRITAAARSAISPSPHFPLGRAIIGRPPGNRNRRRSFCDLEDRGCTADFM